MNFFFKFKLKNKKKSKKKFKKKYNKNLFYSTFSLSEFFFKYLISLLLILS